MRFTPSTTATTERDNARYLPKFLAAVASGNAVILSDGDSRTIPWSSSGFAGWLDRAMPVIGDAYGLPASAGWVPAGRDLIGNFDWTGTGGTVDQTYGLGGFGVTLAAGDYRSRNQVCTGVTVRVTTHAAGSNVRVLIDGLEVLPATSTSSPTTTGHVNVYTSGVLARMAHTVRVEASGAGTVRFDGAYFHDGTTASSGIRWWNGAHYGWSPANHQASGFLAACAAMQPDLVVLCSGLITWTGDTTGRSYYRTTYDLGTAVRQVCSADVFILHEDEPAATLFTGWGATTLPYALALADHFDGALWSMYDRMGTRGGQGNPYGLWTNPVGTDLVHLGPTGMQKFADEAAPGFTLGRLARGAMLRADGATEASSLKVRDVAGDRLMTMSGSGIGITRPSDGASMGALTELFAGYTSLRMVSPTGAAGLTCLAAGELSAGGNTSFTNVSSVGISGLPGSVAPIRICGANAGVPTTGAHVVGDLVYDITAKVWRYCTVSGTPGTWV